jgi:hypothetical protein
VQGEPEVEQGGTASQLGGGPHAVAPDPNVQSGLRLDELLREVQERLAEPGR